MHALRDRANKVGARRGGLRRRRIQRNLIGKEAVVGKKTEKTRAASQAGG